MNLLDLLNGVPLVPPSGAKRTYVMGTKHNEVEKEATYNASQVASINCRKVEAALLLDATTAEEIAAFTKLAVTTVRRALAKLMKDGVVVYQKGIGRSPGRWKLKGKRK